MTHESCTLKHKSTSLPSWTTECRGGYLFKSRAIIFADWTTYALSLGSWWLVDHSSSAKLLVALHRNLSTREPSALNHVKLRSHRMRCRAAPCVVLSCVSVWTRPQTTILINQVSDYPPPTDSELSRPCCC